ncbi:hypothetical protein ACLMJK_006127 [Lecanora helva]
MTDKNTKIMNAEVEHVLGEEAADNHTDAESHESSSVRSVSICSSAHSYTSTFGYNQESWEEYRPRVESLCSTLWPAPTSAATRLAARLRTYKLFREILPQPQVPLIERLQGGDYNRITGITLPLVKGQDAQKFILRTNRWGEGRPDRETAVLHYLRQNTSIPVPEVVKEDYSSNNALEKAYVIQKRISGSDVDSIWESLTHSQRCSIARQMGRVVKTLLSLEHPLPGLIDSLPKDPSISPEPKVVPFELKESDDEIIDETVLQTAHLMKSLPTRLTIGEFFRFQFTRWHTYALTRPFERVTSLFENLLYAVSEMNDMGLLKADRHCLCHVDLHSRNMMAEVQSDGSINITAILDWDEAVIGPKLVNCQPPWWLWQEEGDERVDEEVDWPYELAAAPGFPYTPEKQELRRIFEETAGVEWNYLAYDEVSRLSRCLFILAKDGLKTGEHFKAADRFLREWNELRPTLTT